ncbi:MULTISPECIES: transcriptional regulator [Streptomyces]|uniref:Helix-turn-helix domain-containing protein n=1 Tax=Streptomyces californicus TaxID=67351 RepID=A0ABD7D342_9ACTN|nr:MULTISPECIES: transcriptional regulator [Streptomyces]MYW81704.1 helix-turn-helix domain-containing protein [Streptomyces sp. SID8369]KOG83933.1 ArsR family transcriptional regulator [Streptomyces griseus subsp. rhodochrous]KOU48848.1 ArsR family transcriptional regulator [Streptomyces sp. MMG1522]MBD3545272.1 helix-turn-helix domain-containing protein [Streptomyces sp. JV180]MBK0377621.1 helix-turn-helix domain-containing protein [Streptomyces sp. RB110-1]
MPSNERHRISDLDTLKAISHPLRLKLYRALHIKRTATASQLADQVDEAVSLVSYHLRKLADHGLIEPAEGQGTDGRERWWQPSARGLTYSEADFGDAPETAAVYAAAGRMSFDQHVELYRAHQDSRHTWDAEWRGASWSSENLLRLTAGELADLSREMGALIDRYQEAGNARDAAGDTEGRESVALHTYGFPFRP